MTFQPGARPLAILEAAQARGLRPAYHVVHHTRVGDDGRLLTSHTLCGPDAKPLMTARGEVLRFGALDEAERWAQALAVPEPRGL